MTAFLMSIFSFLWIHRRLKTSSTIPTPSSMTVPLTLLPVYLLCRQLKRTQYPTPYRWLPFWRYPFTSWYVVSWNGPNTQPLIDDCPSNPDDIDLPPGRSSAETSTTSWEVISWDVHHFLGGHQLRRPPLPGRSSAETSTTSWEVISWDVHHFLGGHQLRRPPQYPTPYRWLPFWL